MAKNRRWGGLLRRRSRPHKDCRGRALLEEHRLEIENALWAIDNGYDAVGIDNNLTLAKADYFEVLVDKAPYAEVDLEVKRRRENPEETSA